MTAAKRPGRPPTPGALKEYQRKRDFAKTAEPRGGTAAPVGRLRFVVQKHAASRLHFDFRLELDGVMKSWAVPKGPSLDPAVKRLAMQVEDHPIEYNTFEGTIPEGEYGGGTVMLWDRGTYTSVDGGADPEVDEAALRRGYERGDLKFVLYGVRLRGSWVLVRTHGMRGSSSTKPAWLLIKHRDEYAIPGSDIVAEYVTSVLTGRTMEEIAAEAPPRKIATPRRGGRSAVKTATPTTTAPRPAPHDTPRPTRDAAGKRTRSKASAKRGSTPKRGTPPRTVAARSTEKRAGGRRLPRATDATRASPTASPRSETAGGRAARAHGAAGEGDTDGEGLPRLPFALTHLDKVFFPRDGYTKGDIVRYYVRVSPQLLPVMRDRPLALKRYPDGIGHPFFFQQKAPPPEKAPPGVRIELVMVESEGGPRPRFIGGSLATLLYTVQLGCIGVDPWHARVQSLDTPDYAVIDLDPGDGVPFRRTVEVARWVHDVLESWGLAGVPKTSGSRGIHVYIPLPARSTDAIAVGLTQRIAARVVALHPRHATLERDIARRPPASVYVDFLQNARGKTVAAAYSVRAVDGARVSMPLRWDELTPRLDPREFTIVTAPSRIAEIGDVWAEGMARRNTAAAVRRAMG